LRFSVSEVLSATETPYASGGRDGGTVELEHLTNHTRSWYKLARLPVQNLP
jgi:hypothetical protein